MEAGRNDSVQKYYECGECGSQFLRLGHLHEHIRATRHMSVRCLECDTYVHMGTQAGGQRFA